MGYLICFYMLPAIFRHLVHTSCTYVVLYLNPVWNRALFEECFAHQQRSILPRTSYLGVTSQNSETLTCYMNINFILAEFKQRSDKIKVPILSGFSREKIEAWCCSVAQWCPTLWNSFSLCWLCHPTISFIPFSSCPQSLKLKLLQGRVHTAYGLLDSFFFSLQEFSYVFFQVWPFIHIIANNRISRNHFEAIDCFYPDKLNTKEPLGAANIWGTSF